MADIYVSHTGSDGNAGLGVGDAQAYRTINKAMDNITGANNIVRLLADEDWLVETVDSSNDSSVNGTTVTFAVTVPSSAWVGDVIWFNGVGDGYGYRIVTVNPGAQTLTVERAIGGPSGPHDWLVGDAWNQIGGVSGVVFQPDIANPTWYNRFTSVDGSQATLKTPNGLFAGAFILAMGKAVYVADYRLYVDNIIFDGDGVVLASGGIFSRGASGFRNIWNCDIRNVLGYGINCISGNFTALAYSLIEDCTDASRFLNTAMSNIVRRLNNGAGGCLGLHVASLALNNLVYDVTGTTTVYGITLAGLGCVGRNNIIDDVTGTTAIGVRCGGPVRYHDVSFNIITNVTTGIQVNNFINRCEYNCLYNCTNPITGNIVWDVGNMRNTVDPQFDADYRPRNSAVFQGGPNGEQLGAFPRTWIPPDNYRSRI